MCLAFEMNSFKGNDERVVFFFPLLFVKPQLFDGVESEDQWRDFFFPSPWSDSICFRLFFISTSCTHTLLYQSTFEEKLKEAFVPLT